MKFKEKRHARILEIIKEKAVETQDELTELLIQSGFQTTQATVSRDIKELHLYKTLTKDNKYRYECSDVRNDFRKSNSGKFYGIMRDSILSVDNAMNIIVIRTVAGMAMAVAAALDALHIDGIVGCIAGDDTIMCAVRTLKDTENVIKKLRKIIEDKPVH